MADQPSGKHQVDGPEPRRERKDDHLRLAAEQWTGAGSGGARRNEFDDLEFVHDALGGVSTSDVDLVARVGEWTWATPFYINGMTGGTDRSTEINTQLARAARETGLTMACGSMSIALEDDEAARGFAVLRRENPDGFLLANIGAGRSDSGRRMTPPSRERGGGGSRDADGTEAAAAAAAGRDSNA